MLSWNVTDTTPPLEAALAYGRAGLRVVWIHAPTAQGCTCGSARCERRSWGKHPILAAWQRVASADEQELNDQFLRLKHVPNVGIVLGEQPSGDHLIAIDVDDDARLAALVEEHGELPATLTGRSARGARLFFKAPGDLKNVTGIGGTPGVDMKARGGQVVVAPSLHESGARYSWEYPLHPIAALPDAWVLALKPAYKVPTEFATYTPFTLKEDKRATGRAEKYLHRAVVIEAEMLARIGAGNRNTTLHTALCRLLPLAHGLMLPSGHATVVRELRNAAAAAGLQQREIETTIASAEKWLRESGAVRVLPHEVSRSAANGAPTAPGDGDQPGTVVTPTFDDFGPDVKLLEDNGQPAKVAGNVARMLPFYPLGVPRYDAFTDHIVWPDGRQLEDTDATDVQDWLYSQPVAKRVRAGKDTVHDAIVSYARSHQFDSLHETLRALPAWDEKPRLDTWLIDLAGCQDTPTARLFARLWMISVMARGTRAGSRVDGVLVLEGKQGAGKNRLLEALFAPHLRSLGSYQPGDVEAARIAGSCWVLHDDEFGGAKSDVDALKAFVSSTEDTYRPPYGRELITRKRRAVLVASTNRSAYLLDDTNRRFMPVTVATEKPIDVDGAVVERDQLFAEALAMHEAKEPWWFDASHVDVEEAQDARRAIDALSLDVAKHTAGKDRVQIGDLCDLLAIPPERRDRKLEMRLGSALRELGFKRVRVTAGGVRSYWYERPGSTSTPF